MQNQNKSVRVTLATDGRSISYLVDLATSTFHTEMCTDGAIETTQKGTIGATDSERQEFALKMYHIILAALRTKSGES